MLGEERYKQLVMECFVMAEGAFAYGNLAEATRQIRTAKRACSFFIASTWWSGIESPLGLHFQDKCPKLHQAWVNGELDNLPPM